MAWRPATDCPNAADCHQSDGSRRPAVSASSAGNPFAEDPNDTAPGEGKPPVVPHAAPILDAAGRLTYVGSDGLRYVVAEPPQADSNG